jgi:hypothetical protein
MPFIDELFKALRPLPLELIVHIFSYVPLLELSELGSSSYLLSLVDQPKQTLQFPFDSSTLDLISYYTLTSSFSIDSTPPQFIYFLSPALFEYLLSSKIHHEDFMKVLRYVSPTFSGIGILDSDCDTPLLGLLAHYNRIELIKLLIERNLLDSLDLVQLLLIAAKRNHIELFILLDRMGIVHNNSLTYAASNGR